MASSHSQLYAGLLERLLAQIRDGQGDSDEADEVREQMDLAWSRMDDDERELARALSASLNQLSG